MFRFFGALLLGTALMAPIAVKADDHDRDEHHRRYYDRDHRDWHEWNEREDRAYRPYWQDQNREYREWNKANRREQKEYWRWRHHHGDDDDLPRRTR